MRRVEVKHTPAVQQLMKKGNLKGAYAVACLGATREDWRQLGFECLRRGDLQFARKAFQRQGDYKSISMLNQVQEELQTLHLPIELQRHVCRAYAYASFRDFEAAAEEWAKAGLPQRSSEMFADLRRCVAQGTIVAARSSVCQIYIPCTEHSAQMWAHDVRAGIP